MLPNLRKTPHGYYYLKTVPTDLRQALGKTVIKKALGRDFKSARLEWAELEATTSQLFSSARAEASQERTLEASLEAFLKKDPLTRLKPLPAGREGLANQISALYLAGLSADYAARKSGERWTDASEPEALTNDIERVRVGLKNAVVSGDVSQFVPVVQQLVELRGYRLVDETGDQLQSLTYEFLRAAQLGCQVLAARQRGEFSEPPQLDEVHPWSGPLNLRTPGTSYN